MSGGDRGREKESRRETEKSERDREGEKRWGIKGRKEQKERERE